MRSSSSAGARQRSAGADNGPDRHIRAHCPRIPAALPAGATRSCARALPHRGRAAARSSSVTAPARGRRMPGQRVQQCRLAAAVVAQNRPALSGRDVHGEPPHHAVVGEAGLEPLARSRSWSSRQQNQHQRNAQQRGDHADRDLQRRPQCARGGVGRREERAAEQYGAGNQPAIVGNAERAAERAARSIPTKPMVPASATEVTVAAHAAT